MSFNASSGPQIPGMPLSQSLLHFSNSNYPYKKISDPRDRFEKEFDNVQDVFELQVMPSSHVHLPQQHYGQFHGPPNNKKSSNRQAISNVFLPQRNLNNAFAYDLVPSPSVCTAALRAARRVNDYPTAVRIFEGKSSPSLIPFPFSSLLS